MGPVSRCYATPVKKEFNNNFLHMETFIKEKEAIKFVINKTKIPFFSSLFMLKTSLAVSLFCPQNKKISNQNEQQSQYSQKTTKPLSFTK